MAELTLINLLPVITTLLECHLKTFSISANWGHSVYIYSLICYIFIDTTVYTRVQVEFFGRENGLKKLTSTYIRENMRHTYRITKKCQNSLQQAKLWS